MKCDDRHQCCLKIKLLQIIHNTSANDLLILPYALRRTVINDSDKLEKHRHRYVAANLVLFCPINNLMNVWLFLMKSPIIDENDHSIINERGILKYEEFPLFFSLKQMNTNNEQLKK